MMKRLVAVAWIILLTHVAGCTEDCGDPPRVRLENLATNTADVLIEPSDGSTETLDDMEMGAVSDWFEIETGSVHFTITIRGLAGNWTHEFRASNCYDYTVTFSDENVHSTREHQ